MKYLPKKSKKTLFIAFFALQAMFIQAQSDRGRVYDQLRVKFLGIALNARNTNTFDGNVTIGSSGFSSNITDLTPLSNLTHITGNLTVQRNDQLVNLTGLNNLQSIGGNFIVTSNERFTTLGNFDSLQSIGGNFIVNSNDSLTTLGDFPDLQSIGGYVSVGSNDILTTLGDFPDLQSIDGSFSVRVNRELTTLGNFPALQSIGGSFSMFDNNQLDFLDNFSALQSIGGSFVMARNKRLTTLGNFSNLQSIGGYFSVWDNDTLTSLGNFPALMSIGIGRAHVPSSHSPVSGVSIVVENNSSLSDCSVLTELILVGSTAAIGDIYISSNATGCDSPSEIDTSYINTGYRGNITVTTQTEVNDLYTRLENIKTILGNLTVGSSVSSQRSDITDLTPLSNITLITGDIRIQQNEQLTNLNGLDSLQSIGGYFNVNSNNSLTTLGNFSTLQSVGEYISINNNSSLTTLGNFTDLQSIGQYFSVTGNDSLTTLGDFPDLQTIGGYVSVGSNDILTTLGDFPDLQTIDGYFGVRFNAKLTTLGDFPDLQTIDGYFGVSFNAKLTTLGDFPALMSIGVGETRIRLLSSITDNVSIVVRNNSSLSDCHVLTDFLLGGTHAVNGIISIFNNAIGCNEQRDIRIRYHGDITVTTQEQVNALRIPLARKTIIVGNLTVGSSVSSQRSDITDLTPLSNITLITGNLTIRRNGQLFTLNALNNLRTIGGYFNVSDNDTLTSLGNFPVRTRIGIGGAYVPSESQIIDSVSIVVENNPRLSNCRVLANSFLFEFRAVSGRIYVNNNAIGCNRQSDIKIRYPIDITFTTQADVDDLRTRMVNIDTIDGNLTVGHTDFLSSSQSDITDLTPLSNIVCVTGNVLIRRNGQLFNLNALNNLQTIGGYFEVRDNRKLTTLGDFPVLQTIGGHFEVSSNRELTSLGYFSTLTSIGIGRSLLPRRLQYTDSVSIAVAGNPRLSTCCVLTDFFSNGVNAVIGSIFITNNTMGCNSESDINTTTLRLTSSNESITHNDTDSIAIDFTVGCGATGWTSAITYTPANANFITLFPTGGADQTGAVTLMATSTENTGVERTATITLSTTGGTDTVSQTVAITQAGVPPILTLTPTDQTLAYDAATANDITFNVGGGAMGWESSIDYTPAGANFITLDPVMNANQRDEVMVRVTLTGINAGVERIAVITIRTRGGTGEAVSKTVTITQEAAPVLTLTSDVAVTLPHDATTAEDITFTLGGSATDWSATSSNTSFITVPSTGTGGMISVTVVGTTRESRTAEIMIMTRGSRGSAISKTVTITQEAIPTITVTTKNTIINHDVIGALPITFTLGGSATDWSAVSSNTSFITVPSTGTGGMISVTVVGRTNTGAERTSTITITTRGSIGPSVIETVTITQEAVPVLILTSDVEVTLGHDATAAEDITFTLGGSATDWSATGSNTSFITVPSTGTGGMISVTVVGGANTTGAERTSTITITTRGSRGSAISATVTITQEAVPTLTLTSDVAVTLPHDATTAEDLTFTLGGSAIGWSAVSSNTSFITVPSTGTGGMISVTVVGGSNTTGAERTSTITITTRGSIGPAVIETVTITQEAVPVLTLTSDVAVTLGHDATAAEDLTFTLGGSATDWSAVSSNTSFITVPSTGTGGMISVTVVGGANTTGAERTSTITITTRGSIGPAVIETVTITQEAVPVLTLTSDVAVTLGHDATAAEDLTFTLGGSAIGWSAGSSNTSFITVLSTGTGGMISVTVVGGSNTTGAERTSTITITTRGSIGSAVIETVTITQEAVPVLTLTSDVAVTLGHDATAAEDLTFTLGGSAIGWSAGSSNTSFITVPSTGTGGMISVTVVGGSNTTGAERTSTITITTRGSIGPAVIETVTITQEEAPVLTLTSDVAVTLGHDATAAEDITFTLGGTVTGWTSAITYTPANANFITLSPTEGTSQTDTITLMATPTINTGVERTVTITLTTTGMGTPDSVSLTITQETSPTIMLISHTEGENIAIAYDNTDPITIEFTLGGSATSSMSNISYMPENTNFITLQPENNDEETRTITITLSTNEDTIPRTATITLRTTGHEGTPDSVSFTITQGARADTTTLPPKDTTTTLYSYTRVDFLLYPNPTNGTLTIEGVTGYLQMYIYDLVGREVMTYSLTPSKKTIDVSDLPSGMYVVTLRGKGKTWKEILMKK